MRFTSNQQRKEIDQLKNMLGFKKIYTWYGYENPVWETLEAFKTRKVNEEIVKGINKKNESDVEADGGRDIYQRPRLNVDEKGVMRDDRNTLEATVDELLDACDEFRADIEVKDEKLRRYERITQLRDFANRELTEKCERLEQELKELRPDDDEVSIKGTVVWSG